MKKALTTGELIAALQAVDPSGTKKVESGRKGVTVTERFGGLTLYTTVRCEWDGDVSENEDDDEDRRVVEDGSWVIR